MSFITEHNEKYKDFSPFTSEFNRYDRIYPGRMLEKDYYTGSKVRIGKGTIIYPNVVIYDNVTIGENCIIDSGAVIGAEGFSIHWEDGEWKDMKNVGGVIIGSDVKIGANTCIDRASLEGHYTIIESGVKIDNLCHIAHNVKIRHNTIICPQVCVGGSTDVGEDVWVGIGAILREHIVVGDGAFICMGSVVISDVAHKAKISGHYATDNHLWKAFSNIVRSGRMFFE
jgi:UDP-3-O-[3-hydroxymyristoyl] glucosamine N-acyltransferase